MTQARPRFQTFAEYLTYDDDSDRRYELIDGELIELPPESGLNDWLSICLRDYLITQVDRRLVRLGRCEIQVPVLQPGDAANRYPDLVLLEPIHLQLTLKRLTITADMPPPGLVAEVLSPGRQNRDRDLIRKRAQYAACGIPEYWLIDPEAQTVTVLALEGNTYCEVGVFQGEAAIVSSVLPALILQATQIFADSNPIT
jgi:Uma2 family endonuclease